MSIDRRTFIQSTAALATLSAAGCATTGNAPPQQMAKASASKINTAALKSSADALLGAGARAGDVPGVVAVATNREEMIYEGAFGTTVLGSGIAMTPDTMVWIASMTKAITGLANSYFWIDQQKGVGGVYLSQVLPFADVKALPMFYAFEKSVYQSMA